jgi:hypothetical protein
MVFQRGCWALQGEGVEKLFFFFFEKSIEYIKSAKGCNPWYTEGVEKHYKLVGVFSLDLSDLMWEMCPRSILA